MGNKKNPVFVEKAIRVTDTKTGKVEYVAAFHRKTALSHVTSKAREEALAELGKRFTAEILTVAEVRALKNAKYTDLTGKEAAASEAASKTPDGDQLDIVDAIDEAEVKADAETAPEGHGAIFQ